LEKKLIRQEKDELPGGIINEDGLNLENKVDLWKIGKWWDNIFREAVQFCYIAQYFTVTKSV